MFISVVESASIGVLDTVCKRIVRTFAQPAKYVSLILANEMEGRVGKKSTMKGNQNENLFRFGAITCCAFSPDGRWILMADETCHIRVIFEL